MLSGGEENFYFLKSPDLLWDPPSLLFGAHRLVFFAGKPVGSKDDHSPPSDDEGRNERSYNPSPSYAFILCKGTTVCLFLLVKLFYISIRTREIIYIMEKEMDISLYYRLFGIYTIM